MVREPHEYYLVCVMEFNLEVRTEQFAGACRSLIRKIEKDLANMEDSKQLVRASGSVGANCVEANEAFSPKDRAFRFKICRKEARESRYWLNLLYSSKSDLAKERERLVDEATQLVKIFTTIVKKIEGSDSNQTEMT